MRAQLAFLVGAALVITGFSGSANAHDPATGTHMTLSGPLTLTGCTTAPATGSVGGAGYGHADGHFVLFVGGTASDGMSSVAVTMALDHQTMVGTPEPATLTCDLSVHAATVIVTAYSGCSALTVGAPVSTSITGTAPGGALGPITFSMVLSGICGVIGAQVCPGIPVICDLGGPGGATASFGTMSIGSASCTGEMSMVEDGGAKGTAHTQMGYDGQAGWEDESDQEQALVSVYSTFLETDAAVAIIPIIIAILGVIAAIITIIMFIDWLIQKFGDPDTPENKGKDIVWSYECDASQVRIEGTGTEGLVPRRVAVELVNANTNSWEPVGTHCEYDNIFVHSCPTPAGVTVDSVDAVSKSGRIVWPWNQESQYPPKKVNVCIKPEARVVNSPQMPVFDSIDATRTTMYTGAPICKLDIGISAFGG